ncbi:MAG: hypothetical protein EOO20_01760 [Chryseobacterium sp.]|nr:MAG: hypothetical protein EOO20_01760 [Chryseobacterium sp.]
MEQNELTDFQQSCVDYHQENLAEEIHKGLAFLLKSKTSDKAFKEHFPTLSKQIRAYDCEFQPGDQVRTVSGLKGDIAAVIGEKPKQKIKIRLESWLADNGSVFKTVPFNHVKMSFDTSEFVNLIEPIVAPF